MEYLIGIGLAAAAFVFARIVGLDRDRAFYPTVMIVIACIYGLFAVIGGSPKALVIESMIGAGFIALSVVGFKASPWFVAAALFAHGIFDIFHGGVITNPGVPVWWPGFCMAYDVTAAAGLAWLLVRTTANARRAPDKIR